MGEGGGKTAPPGRTRPSSPPPAAGAGASGSAAPAAVDPLVGRVIDGRFRIVSLIARGGMGRVYRAEQAPLGRICALKILTTTYEGAHDPEFHKRFFLEASIASKITHPNSVTIFDYGQTEDDVYYMAMEYLEGVTLHRAIRTSGPFPEARVAHIGRQVCRALREAHALGCIHRDLKPANIFLTEHGDEPDFVKVLDFGLVKNVAGEGKSDEQLTQTGLFMGSPKYMAPEQIRGDRVDGRTDVYSLGIILFEMLTGKVPFERLTSLNTLMAQVNDAPPRLREVKPDVKVSPELEELILRAMAKDPEARVASMDEMLGTLRRIGGMGLTGEYQALGAANSGPYPRAAPTGASEPPPAPGSMPRLASIPPPPLVPSLPHAASSSPSVAAPTTPSVPPPLPSNSEVGPTASASMAAFPLTSPSGTPAPSARPATTSVPDFRGGRRKVYAAAGVGAVVLVGAAFAAVSASSSSSRDVTKVAPSANAPPVASSAPVAAGSVVPPALPPPPPTPVITTTLSVRFVSDPPGASVKENGEELCAATPCEHPFAADMSVEHKVVFARSGYLPETRVVRGADAQIAVTLSPVRVQSSRTHSPPRPPPEPGNTTPQGFKDIPY